MFSSACSFCPHWTLKNPHRSFLFVLWFFSFTSTAKSSIRCTKLSISFNISLISTSSFSSPSRGGSSFHCRLSMSSSKNFLKTKIGTIRILMNVRNHSLSTITSSSRLLCLRGSFTGNKGLWGSLCYNPFACLQITFWKEYCICKARKNK